MEQRIPGKRYNKGKGLETQTNCVGMKVRKANEASIVNRGSMVTDEIREGTETRPLGIF